MNNKFEGHNGQWQIIDSEFLFCSQMIVRVLNGARGAHPLIKQQKKFFQSAALSHDRICETSSSLSNRSQISSNPSCLISRRQMSSVSKDEVTKFSKMAQTWWEPEKNPLISMNPVRMSFILQTLQQTHSVNMEYEQDSSLGEPAKFSFKPLKGLKALDVGCGGGLLSESLARLGANVTAVDPSVHVADAAREHSKMEEVTRTIDYKGGYSVEDLAKEYSENQERDLFDVICILEVIEHAADPLNLVQNAASLLKKPSKDSPGGVLFVSTINRTAKSFAVAIVGGEYILGKLPIGTHSWEKFLSPKEVRSMVAKFGMKEYSTNGMVLRPPFYDMSWYLDDGDKDINWIGAYSHD